MERNRFVVHRGYYYEILRSIIEAAGGSNTSWYVLISAEA